MVAKIDDGFWHLVSDTQGTAWRHTGGNVHYSVRVVSGSGTLKMQISYDAGTTWINISDSSHTATAQANINALPPGVLIRPDLSGSSTPDFEIRAYSVD
jgi:hypothetical protein|tara:strand:- start:1572 stop:1868 length:297 start_codon:yes stop_codon:yes gene_type:complete